MSGSVTIFLGKFWEELAATVFEIRRARPYEV